MNEKGASFCVEAVDRTARLRAPPRLVVRMQTSNRRIRARGETRYPPPCSFREMKRRRQNVLLVVCSL